MPDLSPEGAQLESAGQRPASWRPWTRGDQDRACALRGEGLTAKEIGRLLGRSVPAIYNIWRARGHRRRRPCRARLIGPARRLHALGYSASAIGRRLGVSHTAMQNWLNAEGLRPNGHAGAPGRAAAGERLRACLPAGWRLIDYRTEARRREAAALGWPEVETAPLARLLTALWPGDKTERELAQALGYRMGCVKNPHQCPALRRLLRRLRALDHVRLVDTRPGPSGRPAHVWGLSPWLRARKEEERC
jgi:hypothetical protein